MALSGLVMSHSDSKGVVSKIGRITTDGVITEYSAGISLNATACLIAWGPDGNMWFTEQTLPGIARITPQGVVTEFTAGLTAGGAAWGIIART